MAFNDFYIAASGGSDINAGSAGPVVTDAGGAYAQGTGAGGTDRYTAHGGTSPFSATVIGEWISVYTAAAAQTTFVGQITAINGGGTSVDISLTAIYGTRPANGSTKTATTGGSWASLLPLINSSALGAVATIPASTRVNIQAGTYANTTNTRTIGWAGTATTTLHFRGYNASPGDLDTIPTTTRTPGTNMPNFTFSTGRLILGGAQQTWSACSFVGTGSPAAVLVTSNAAQQSFHRCRMEAQSSSSASNAAFTNSGGNCRLTECWLKATTTATQVLTLVTGTMIGCAVEGGVSGISFTNICSVVGCTIANAATQAILSTGGTSQDLINCTIYNCGTDGIKWTTLPTVATVVNNVFDTLSGTAINNATAGNTNVIHAASNSFFSVGAQTAGLGDCPVFDSVAETFDPLVAGASLNFKLSAAATSWRIAAPQLFENQANNVGQGSVGALQRGVTLFNPGLSGGLR